MKHLQIFVVLLVIGILVSCNSSDEAPKKTDLGYDFLPLKKGLYHIYDVEEDIYSLGVKTTLNYQLKTVVVDSFANSEGGYTYISHRSKRSNENSAWEPFETWSFRKNKTEAIRSEGNIPYVVLNFPVSNGGTWNGNKYNNQINRSNNNSNIDEYEITSMQTSYTVNNVEFSDCLIIQQEAPEDLIVFYDERYEVYAKHIGLIHSVFAQYEFCTEDHCRGQQIVDNGIMYKLSLVQYGKE